MSNAETAMGRKNAGSETKEIASTIGSCDLHLFNKEELKDKSLLVLYLNMSNCTKEFVVEAAKTLRCFKYKYDIIVLPVWDQDTKVEVFSDKGEMERHRIKINDDLTDLKKLEKLI